MPAPAPSMAHLDLSRSIGSGERGIRGRTRSERTRGQAHRAALQRALGSGLRSVTFGSLNRIRVGLMGWLTVFLVLLAVAALIGITCAQFGRR